MIPARGRFCPPMARNSARAVLTARVAKAPGPPAGLVQFRDEFHTGARHRADDKLGDSLPPRHHEGPRTMVDQGHTHLASVVSVDSPGGVEHGDTVLDREAAAGPNLGLESGGKRYENAGGNERVRSGRQVHGGRDGGPQVHPRRLFAHVGGRRQIAGGRCLLDANYYVALRQVNTDSRRVS